jgi:hypothetical protein
MMKTILFFLTSVSFLLATPTLTTYEKLVVPEHGAYTGAYVDFGEGEDGVTLEAMENFETMVKKHQALIGFGSFWARQKFPTEQVNLVRSYGAVPLLYWSPWDAPFDNGEIHGPDKFALDKILSGKWDHYIDAWADGAKAVPSQFFVTFGCEMNGTWFPWSGYFYGKGKIVGDKKTKPLLYAGAEKYKQAYRYVVDRVRARGANNILWVFHVNNYSYPNGKWNLAAAYYPGPNYVDWLAMSLYGKQFAKEDWDLFEPLLEWPYKELCMLDPNKPIMLAEWGVAEPHESDLKGKWFQDAFQVMTEKKYPRLKAAIVWHERWENADGTFSNLRINSSQSSLKGYQEGVASPYWIDKPIWKK